LKDTKSKAVPKPAAQALAMMLSLTDRSIDTFPAQLPQTIRRGNEGDKQRIKQAVQQTVGPDTQVDIAFRKNMDVKKEVQKFPPKEAVAPRFYLEYVNDEESTRFGHFVFDII
jgi:hypothetical protein